MEYYLYNSYCSATCGILSIYLLWFLKFMEYYQYNMTYFVLSLVEYSMRAILSSSVGVAILQSPIVNYNNSVCLQFSYILSSDTGYLRVLASPVEAPSDFRSLARIDYPTEEGFSESTWRQINISVRFQCVIYFYIRYIYVI